MRLLHLTHPDQVEELPAGFGEWCLAFDRTEKEAQKELEEAEVRSHG